jgi:hypothetical protein
MGRFCSAMYSTFPMAVSECRSGDEGSLLRSREGLTRNGSTPPAAADAAIETQG